MRRICSLVMLLSLAFVQIRAEVRDIPYDKLPEKARRVIELGFSDCKVKSVEMEKRASLVQYEAKLSGGYKVQFSRTGLLTEIECNKQNPVPVQVLPPKIRAFMAVHFPENDVMGYEHDGNLYVIVLDNSYELTFNSSGRLIDAEKP